MSALAMPKPQVLVLWQRGENYSKTTMLTPENCPDLKNILVVDDSSINIELARAMLKNIFPASTIHDACNGLQAVQFVANNPVDLVLMDVRMPFMDGITATIEIRKLEMTKGGHILIIALTAGAVQEEGDSYEEAGMDGFVTKPVSSNSLRNAIIPLITERNSHNTSPLAENPDKPISPGRTKEHFDMDALMERIGHDSPLLRLMLEDREWGELIQDLSAAHRCNDMDVVCSLAHRIKGSALNFHLPRLAHLASMTEDRAKSDPSSIAPLILGIEKEWGVLDAILSETLDSLT